MRAQVYLTVDDLEASRTFWCDELGLFTPRFDWGMGTIALAGRQHPDLDLVLHEREVHEVSVAPVFGLQVASLRVLLDQWGEVTFTSGGTVLSKDPFEYALGRNLSVRDPSGHVALLYEGDA